MNAIPWLGSPIGIVNSERFIIFSQWDIQGDAPRWARKYGRPQDIIKYIIFIGKCTPDHEYLLKPVLKAYDELIIRKRI